MCACDVVHFIRALVRVPARLSCCSVHRLPYNYFGALRWRAYAAPRDPLYVSEYLVVVKRIEWTATQEKTPTFPHNALSTFSICVACLYLHIQIYTAQLAIYYFRAASVRCGRSGCTEGIRWCAVFFWCAWRAANTFSPPERMLNRKNIWWSDDPPASQWLIVYLGAVFAFRRLWNNRTELDMIGDRGKCWLFSLETSEPWRNTQIVTVLICDICLIITIDISFLSHWVNIKFNSS